MVSPPLKEAIALDGAALPTGGDSGWTARNIVTLTLLLFAYVFSYIDRQIVAVLATQIKAEFSLSDTQLGLIAGLAFAIFYTSVAVPVAWLADRAHRAKIIAIACACWSLFTAACGLAQNFTQLFVARMGVGIGEAGSVAPSLSLISDLFPPRQRSRAYSIFYFGIPIGSSLGIFFGGWIASNVDWRAAFIVVGLAGIPLALLILLAVPDPARGRNRAPQFAGAERPPVGVIARRIISTPTFWLFSFASACSSVLMYGLMFWLPSLLQRSFGLPLLQTSWYFGAIVLIGGILGIWSGGWLVDRLGPARKSAYAIVPAVALLLAAPTYTLAIFAPNLTVAFLLFTLGQVLGLVGASPIATAIQHVVPSSMRTTTFATGALISNVIGLGFGTVILGVMSDAMTATYGNDALKYSLLYGLLFYVAGALFLIPAAFRIEKEWVG